MLADSFQKGAELGVRDRNKGEHEDKHLSEKRESKSGIH